MNPLPFIRPFLALIFAASLLPLARSGEFYQAPKPGTHTRWVSPENPTGAKGAGGQLNRGAKGMAFIVVKPGETAVLADLPGAGIIHRMWLSGTIPRNEEQRRLVRLEMYWDGAKTPAVAAPIGDFFGVGLGLLVAFENALFSSPEGRSYNFTVPMPYRKGAKVLLVNESAAHALVWYDLNYTTVKKHPRDVMYFHAAWRRESPTALGRDFEILPRVQGKGRYLGANIGVIGGADYRGTWFGEGEVKVYLDGDTTWPTLVGTGTEDYIGSGWGQGEYRGRIHGSPVSDSQNDLYAFYRFHLDDPVYFHRDCRVTIQQIGNAGTDRVREMLARGVELQPVWVLDTHGGEVLNLTGPPPSVHLLLDRTDLPGFNDPQHPSGGCNFYRRDDVSATAYFYLDRPENGLPALASGEVRMHQMKENVWSKAKAAK
ncbi:MAG: glycoside hydrolase family 172 protein [Limisphaerales bacterium]